MGEAGNAIISFKQIRKVAAAVKEIQCWKGDRSHAIKAFEQGLLADIKSRTVDDEQKAELLLAVMEWQRVSEVQLNLNPTFHLIADEINSGRAGSLKRSIFANYGAAKWVDLVDWLIQQIGAQASLAMIKKRQKKRGNESIDLSDISSIESPAILLDCLCQMNEERHGQLPASYFHVVALDEYLKAFKGTKDISRYCIRFSRIISTSTKLHLIFHDFEIRRQRHDREQMYSQIYSGSNYQRSGLEGSNRKRRLLVRRDSIVEDSMVLIGQNDGSLLDGIHIEFIGEEGEDAGGLKKEWILLLTSHLVAKVFQQGEDKVDSLQLNPMCQLAEAELMGVVLGLSLILQIVIDVSIPRLVYRQLLSKPLCCTLEDLKEVKPSLANGLGQILDWEESKFSQRLSLNFTCNSSQNVIVDLIPDGDSTPVTYANRNQYVQRMCEHIAFEQSIAQLEALQHGFDRVCHDVPSLQLLSVDELKSLICGQEIPLSVHSLKKCCTVEGQGHFNDDYIDQFWSVIEESDNESIILKSLLHFVTANHRVSLTNSIAFQLVVLRGQEFVHRLPTASTCTNTLFLPRYPTKQLLQSRLLTALRHGVGFGLK